METPPSPSHVVIAYDATKERDQYELRLTMDGIRKRGDILRDGVNLLVLGVLHKVTHPMGYQVKACVENFGSSVRAMEEEVKKKSDEYAKMLLLGAIEFEDEGVSIEVKITAGTPLKKVISQEVLACKTTWVILDRHLKRDLRYYLTQIPSKLAIINDSLGLEILRVHATNGRAALVEDNFLYSFSKAIPRRQNIDQQSISCNSYPQIHSSVDGDSMSPSIYGLPEHYSKQEKSGLNNKEEQKLSSPSQRIKISQNKNLLRKRYSGAPVLCAACGQRTELYIKDSMKYSFPEIHLSTNDLSEEEYDFSGKGGRYGVSKPTRIRH